jgi:tetratricopeptide (TPR) repeat protein
MQKNLDEAEKSYARATEVHPTFYHAFLNLGRVRMSQKKYDTAIAALDQAVTLQPKSAEANFYLGEAYLQVKKGSKAVGYLYAALELEPVKMAEAHLRLAALYNGAGMKDKAAAEYEQFLTKVPDYPQKKQLEQYISANKKQ